MVPNSHQEIQIWMSSLRYTTVISIKNNNFFSMVVTLVDRNAVQCYTKWFM